MYILPPVIDEKFAFGVDAVPKPVARDVLRFLRPAESVLQVTV